MLAAYLLRAFLQLRDRCNKSGHVRLLGIGKAIPTALLVSQIVRSKIQNAASIIVFSSKQSNKIDQDLTTVEVTIKLNPTEQDKQEPGYQAPLDPDYESKDDYSTDLFDYVMIYVRELYEIKTQRRRPQRADEKPRRPERSQQKQPQEERQQSQQPKGENNENRGQYKKRGNVRNQYDQNTQERERDIRRDDRRQPDRGDDYKRRDQGRDRNQNRDSRRQGESRKSSSGRERDDRNTEGQRGQEKLGQTRTRGSNRQQYTGEREENLVKRGSRQQ